VNFDFPLFSDIFRKLPRKHFKKSTRFYGKIGIFLIEFFLHIKGARKETKGNIQIGDTSINYSIGNRVKSFKGIDTYGYSIQTWFSFVDGVFLQWHSRSRSMAAREN